MDSLRYYSEKNKYSFIQVVYLQVFKNIKLKNTNNLNFVAKQEFKNRSDLLIFANKLDPEVILISGRMNSDYLYIAKNFHKRAIRVTLQDTLFTNSIKQKIQRCFSRFLYKRYFDKFWGIGLQQANYAKFIGFKEKDIYSGFYVAAKIFFENYIPNKIHYKSKFKFLYVGRLVKEKNIVQFSSVLESINNQFKSNHEILIIGEGYLYNKLRKFNCVKLLGLKTQKEIINIAKESDVFSLPSVYEPWGVVVHEMTALGLPVLCSSNCGSSFNLVKDDFNGYVFDPFDKQSIRSAIIKIININSNLYAKFSKNSNLLSRKINHDNWNKTLNKLINL